MSRYTEDLAPLIGDISSRVPIEKWDNFLLDWSLFYWESKSRNCEDPKERRNYAKLARKARSVKLARVLSR